METLAPTDGRYFAEWITNTCPVWLDDKRVRSANDWGDPLQAPAWLLGTRQPWSPTSLRYLAHAIWLAHAGYVQQGGKVLEIGVGFGGLAAMLAITSNASIMLRDLPEVEIAAKIQMRELGLPEHVIANMPADENFCLISNYAFTELNRQLQDQYIENYASRSTSGVIISNASMFSATIGGRSSLELVAALNDFGLNASIVADAPILGPSDGLCGNHVIAWNRPRRI